MVGKLEPFFRQIRIFGPAVLVPFNAISNTQKKVGAFPHPVRHSNPAFLRATNTMGFLVAPFLGAYRNDA